MLRNPDVENFWILWIWVLQLTSDSFPKFLWKFQPNRVIVGKVTKIQYNAPKSRYQKTQNFENFKNARRSAIVNNLVPSHLPAKKRPEYVMQAGSSSSPAPSSGRLRLHNLTDLSHGHFLSSEEMAS